MLRRIQRALIGCFPMTQSRDIAVSRHSDASQACACAALDFNARCMLVKHRCARCAKLQSLISPDPMVQNGSTRSRWIRFNLAYEIGLKLKVRKADFERLYKMNQLSWFVWKKKTSNRGIRALPQQTETIGHPVFFPLSLGVYMRSFCGFGTIGTRPWAQAVEVDPSPEPC